MVGLHSAQPLVSIAARHPDGDARRIALETLAYLPLAPDAKQALIPIAAAFSSERDHSSEVPRADRPGRRFRRQPASTVAYTATARSQEIGLRLLERTFNGTRINVGSDELPVLATLTSKRAGMILVAGLRQLAAASGDARGIGDAILDLALALPEPLELPLHEILASDEIVRHMPRRVLAWVLSRVGPDALARQLGVRIEDASLAEQTRLLPWMRDIAASLESEPPYIRSQAGLSDRADADALRSMLESFESVPMYPRIECDEHPVSGSQLAIEVGLSGAAQPGTVGIAYLPAGFHRLRVHLLFGDDSQWGECSVGQVEKKPARFTVTVPQIKHERDLLAVRVNFYLADRWVGEGERNLDVRDGPDVAPLRKVPPPELPSWRNQFAVEPGAQPPDLIVRIQRKGGVGEYVWHCVSRHANLPLLSAEDSSMALGKDAETYVRQLFAPHAGKKLNELKTADIEGAGELIYQATPKVFKDAYWTVRNKLGDRLDSIQFITDEPYIPWELMRVSDDVRAPDAKAEILAIRHSVGRWLSTESARLSQRIRVRRVAVAASDYASVARVSQSQRLPWAAEEKALLRTRYSAREIALVSDAVRKFLETGGAQVLHFACHGTMYVGNPMGSCLIMEDTDDLKATVVNRQEVRRGLGNDRPLIFLNACEVGGSAAALSLVAGFPNAFLYAGAAAVVCPLWVVADATAKKIAEAFYEALLVESPRAPATLGAVMRAIRRRWSEEGNLTYLAYVLYGDPLAKVEYEPELQGVETTS